MINVAEHFRRHAGLVERAWLVVGKGPSFSGLARTDLDSFVTVGLNHTIRVFRSDYCHIMDMDVVLSLGELIGSQTGYLIMPEYPHVSYQLPGLKGVFHKPGAKNLQQWAEETPILAQLLEAGRLLQYRASSHGYSEAEEVVEAGSFSASTVISLLGNMGVKQVRTLGVDGGLDYSDGFKDLDTRLEAGQDSFDIQFQEMARTRHRYDMDLLPLGDEEEIAVYVGTEKEQDLAFRVLEYSISRRSSRSVTVHHLGRSLQKNFPQFYELTADLPTGTPFSLQRFAIPLLNGRRGRAIYVDSDMQVFTDITRLWTQPMGENDFISAAPRPGCDRPPQLSVMLIDCERASWDLADLSSFLQQGGDSYDRMFLHGEVLGRFERTLPWKWNALEYYSDDVELLHYTNMATQPWLSWRNPLSVLWGQELLALVEEQPQTMELLNEHVARAWVRPSIAWQVEQGVDDSLRLPRKWRARDDREFVPPHAYIRDKRAQALTGFGVSRPTALQVASYRLFSYSRYFALRLGLFGVARNLRSIFGKVYRAVRTGFRSKP